VSVRSAIELANRGSKYPAELFFEDEESCNSTKALTAYTYLHTVKKIDVLVASCLGGARAIGPLARRSGVPLFVSGRTSREFHAENPNAATWLSLLDFEGVAVARLIRERGWKRGNAMVESGYFGVQFAQGIRVALAGAAEPKPSMTESGSKVGSASRDFEYKVMEVELSSVPVKAEVQRLLRGDPDVIFLMLSDAAATFVIKQLKAQRYAGAVILQSSMLYAQDPKARAPFVGALQLKFQTDEKEFLRLRSELRLTMGEEVADDFVFSYDGFGVLLDEAATCRVEPSGSSFEACLAGRMRNEVWREGASGRFRLMRDGSVERLMVVKTVSESGYVP
jgi:ABC-type branched-subunit amino acid transport system substrate-binding protein